MSQLMIASGERSVLIGVSEIVTVSVMDESETEPLAEPE